MYTGYAGGGLTIRLNGKPQGRRESAQALENEGIDLRHGTLKVSYSLN